MPLRSVLVSAFNWSWDTYYGVETRRHSRTTVGHAYEPIGLHHVRAMLREAARYAPITETTVVDVGSGKGRPALYAARAPYRRVIGVERSPELHACACDNLRHYRGRMRAPVMLVCADARDFEWPAAPLVVLLFNPFPDAIMDMVVARLPRETLAICLGEYTCREPFVRAGWTRRFDAPQRTLFHLS